MINKNIDGNPKQTSVYSWKSASVTADGTAAATDLIGVTGFTALFTPFSFASSPTRKRLPTKVTVEASAAAYININGGDTITIGATSSFEATDLVIESIGISTGGAGVTITVYLQ